MSMILAASELIRQAAVHAAAQQRLDMAVEDPTVAQGLIFTPVTTSDLPWLSASEWLWFAGWRQRRGGPLDQRILQRLEGLNATGSRTARFELRGLVLRDPATIEAAENAMHRDEPYEQPGLAWLSQHGRQARDPQEVARDALQYGTEASWFVLRVLTDRGDRAGDLVRTSLQRMANSRQVDPDIVERWAFREG